MKVVTIVGARPQFIKAAPVSKELRKNHHQEILIHTGQHYEYQMSRVFFEELDIPEPDLNLEVGSGTHGFQTAHMLMGVEEVLQSEKPDWVIVYGDANSTLAGALAAVKLNVPLAHVEAGLRSFNREMPEERNRVIVDHCSDLFFCPTKTAIKHLAREGISQDVHLVGDTMYDSVLSFGDVARQSSKILEKLALRPGSYLLATVHRAYNTDSPEALCSILTAFSEIKETIVFPIHPRTKHSLSGLDGALDLSQMTHVQSIKPVSYLDMLMLEQNARVILTDSGGVQKEAYFFGIPCITLRPETEWTETVESGWNVVVGTNQSDILDAVQTIKPPKARGLDFGGGKAASRIVKILARSCTHENEIMG